MAYEKLSDDRRSDTLSSEEMGLLYDRALAQDTERTQAALYRMASAAIEATIGIGDKTPGEAYSKMRVLSEATRSSYAQRAADMITAGNIVASSVGPDGAKKALSGFNEKARRYDHSADLIDDEVMLEQSSDK